jgi:hypothetical protein
MFAAMADALEQRAPATAPAALRACTCVGAAPTEALQDRWRRLTGVELRVARGIQDGAHA